MTATPKDKIHPDRVKEAADFWRKMGEDTGKTFIPVENCNEIADMLDELHERMKDEDA